MSKRSAFIDVGVGETRGVVMLDGRPERLILRRDDDDPRLALGARLVARVVDVEPAIGAAFLDLGEHRQAMLAFRGDARPARGSALEVEIRSEPRAGKLATVRPLGPAEGPPRLLMPGPSVADVLVRLTDGDPPARGGDARRAADEAEAEALETVHPLPGGGTLAIEPTRALTAIDVDVGDRKGADSKRVTRQANLAAIDEAARLLRLKGLGGIVVIDLAGRGHDGAALLAAARRAFAPDNPGVAIGPVGRFGTMELSIPRRIRPVVEQLCGDRGEPSDRTLAQHLIRRIAGEAESRPGDRLVARCAPAVAAAAGPLARALAARIGARFTIESDPGCARDVLEVAGA